MEPRTIYASFVIACLALTPAWAAQSITECGQTIRGRASLGADLDCTGAPDPAIHAYDARIELNGHTLAAMVLCERDLPLGRKQGGCAVVGPGEIRGCVASLQGVQVDGVTMTDPAGLCAAGTPFSPASAVYGTIVRIADSTITGYPHGCVQSPFHWRGGGNVSISGSTIGDCSTADPGGGPAAAGLGKVKIRNSSLQGGVIAGRKARIGSSVITGPEDAYPGIWMHEAEGPSTLVVTDSVVTGIDGNGIEGDDVRLDGSTVSGNCLAGAGGCVDILASGRVSSSNTTCDKSYCSSLADACGVCSGD